MLSNLVATGHMWLLSTWNVQMRWAFHCIYFYLFTFKWLLLPRATIMDSTNLDPNSNPRETNTSGATYQHHDASVPPGSLVWWLPYTYSADLWRRVFHHQQCMPLVVSTGERRFYHGLHGIVRKNSISHWQNWHQPLKSLYTEVRSNMGLP